MYNVSCSSNASAHFEVNYNYESLVVIILVIATSTIKPINIHQTNSDLNQLFSELFVNNAYSFAQQSKKK